jgi:hypothetical protein
MPFKTFTAGTLATASDVNTYLMNQSIPTFSSAGARNSAITSPVEGQFAYVNSNDILSYYTGSGWANALFASTWVAYTPTLTNITLGSGGTSAFYYQVVGKTLNVRGRITLGTTGALTGVATFSLPTNAITADQFWDGGAVMIDGGATNYPGMIRVGTSTATVLAYTSNMSYVTSVNTSSSIPFTWASTDVINVGFTYEGV